MGHLLLGAKIALSAIFFVGGFWLVYISFKHAGDALDLVLDGFKYQWGVVGFWLFLSLAGAGLASGVVTYWLSIYGPS